MELVRIARYIRENDRRLELSKEYIEYLKKAKRSKETETGGIKGGGLSMDNVTDDYGEDEDMMGDL